MAGLVPAAAALLGRDQARGDPRAVLAGLPDDQLAMVRRDAAPDVPGSQRKAECTGAAEWADASHARMLVLVAVVVARAVLVPAAVALVVTGGVTVLVHVAVVVT